MKDNDLALLHNATLLDKLKYQKDLEK